jgi:hypothetical protein
MADEPPLLPELARSLRTLGTPRDAATEAAHAAVFVPLLEARVRAARGGVRGALAALRAAPLAKAIESRASEAAAAGQSDPARARARVAQAREILEPLRESLRTLDSLAGEAASETSTEWEAWVAQLRRVFVAADESCGRLAILFATSEDTPARGWFGAGPRAR